MAKIQKKWVNLDRAAWWVVSTDLMIDATTDTNVKDYIDAQVASWVTVTTNTVDPTATDDAAAGHAMWDVWINTDTDEAFRIVDTTNWAAVWIKTSLTSDELSTDALKTEARTKITITATNITNKYVDLANAPDAWKCEVTPMWGWEQELDVDFAIVEWATAWVNDRLSWDTKWMDWIIAENDILQVEYKYL